MDKDLAALRKARWAKAFTSDFTSGVDEDDHTGVNRKATIVLEHLIQASDVSHTMQHWHVYKKVSYICWYGGDAYHIIDN